MKHPSLSQSLRSFCLLTSILGLERKFAPGMKDSGTWENFTVECTEGIVKNSCSAPGKATRSDPKGDRLAGKKAKHIVQLKPLSTGTQRHREEKGCPRDALLSSVPFSLLQALRKVSGLEAEPSPGIFLPGSVSSPLRLHRSQNPGAGQVPLPPSHWIPYSPPDWNPPRRDLNHRRHLQGTPTHRRHLLLCSAALCWRPARWSLSLPGTPTLHWAPEVLQLKISYRRLGALVSRLPAGLRMPETTGSN